MTEAAAAALPRAPAILDRSGAALSALAVLGMLLGALVIVTDVLLRWLMGSAVVALNEVMSHVFAVAVAATLPAGAVPFENPWPGRRVESNRLRSRSSLSRASAAQRPATLATAHQRVRPRAN